jgi:hypothetical protein
MLQATSSKWISSSEKQGEDQIVYLYNKIAWCIFTRKSLSRSSQLETSCFLLVL